MHGTLTGPLLRRTFDPAFLNAVANDPEVRPYLGGEGAIDLGPLAGNVANVLLQSTHGGFVCTCQERGVYEVHSLFLPSGRRGHAIECAREAMEWMFTRTDCTVLFSKVPTSNPAAKGLAAATGLRTLFERDDASLGPCEYVELDVMRWAMGNPALEAHGEAFHEALEAAKATQGSELPVHPDDASHERAVGAAMLMFRHGQPAKAAAFYNRWARFAGYAQIHLLSLAPLVVDIGDAVVGLGDHDMEILRCR